MTECCATCANCFEIEKLDYSHGCKHTAMEGFACLAFRDEGLVCWMVNTDRVNGMCEGYVEKRKEEKADG